MSTTPQRQRRITRGRAAFHGTAQRPRIAVQRTAKHFRAQAIDDDTGQTLFAVADDQLGLDAAKASGVKQAALVGGMFAKAAQRADLVAFVFDRRGYRYHGRVKQFADIVRQAGLSI